jgi:hypothetical protein
MPSVTFTVPGQVKWTCPLNVTSIQVECWASSSGGYCSPGLPGGHGGYGGEYAAEPSLTPVPGMTYYGSIGQGGTGGTPGAQAGGPGGNTTWNSGQVTAHGATATAPGSGSANTVHHNGGSGGTGGAAGSGNAGGGGGGGSGAPASAGGNGTAGTTSAPGAGAAAQAGGAAGGNGGAAGKSGSKGGNPGGGGGGGGAGLHPGGTGGPGQIRITWTSAPGAPASYPVPSVPFFPAGYRPQQADLNSWLHDPFAFLENRVVARVRQAVTAQALPSSGAGTVLEFDTVDEDPLGGWTPSAWSWGPPAGWSGWYEVTVTLYSQPLAAGGAIRPGLVTPETSASVAVQYPGAGNNGGACGASWFYLIGGQDSVQATGSLLNASANVNTDIASGQQSGMEVTWISA